jgi:hypothetical protein
MPGDIEREHDDSQPSVDEPKLLYFAAYVSKVIDYSISMVKSQREQGLLGKSDAQKLFDIYISIRESLGVFEEVVSRFVAETIAYVQEEEKSKLMIEGESPIIGERQEELVKNCEERLKKELDCFFEYNVYSEELKKTTRFVAEADSVVHSNENCEDYLTKVYYVFLLYFRDHVVEYGLNCYRGQNDRRAETTEGTLVEGEAIDGTPVEVEATVLDTSSVLDQVSNILGCEYKLPLATSPVEEGVRECFQAALENFDEILQQQTQLEEERKVSEERQMELEIKRRERTKERPRILRKEQKRIERTMQWRRFVSIFSCINAQPPEPVRRGVPRI